MWMTDVFVDGGIVGRNPSEIGGTWAWCEVIDGERVQEQSGSVTPEEIGLPRVTNNFTELLAAVLALEAMPDGWCGTLYTDSKITLYRLKGSRKFAGIPDSLRERCERQRERLRFEVVLLGGHPTVLEMYRGRRSDGTPVSCWNVWADRQCGREAEAMRERMLEAVR